MVVPSPASASTSLPPASGAAGGAADPLDDLDDLDAIAAAMRHLQRLRSSRSVHAALSAAAGITLSQQAVEVLTALRHTVPVARLAEDARMDVAAVSRQLRVLEEAGYLTRHPSPDHGSVVLVTPTPLGRSVAARVAALRHEHLAMALSTWSRGDRHRLATLLRRLVDDLQATPYADAGPTKPRRPR
jgi:DNA-binding MarR family transcriptional regulator